MREARGAARDGFKRKPVIHLFDISKGDELWKRELESEIEMMPTLWSEKEGEEFLARSITIARQRFWMVASISFMKASPLSMRLHQSPDN